MGSIHLIDVYIYLITSCVIVAAVMLRIFKSFRPVDIVTSALRHAQLVRYRDSNEIVVVCVAGVVVAASWLYVAELGAGHAFAWKYSLIELPATYPLFCAAGFTVLVMSTVLTKMRTT